jgi:hypothetical protein
VHPGRRGLAGLLVWAVVIAVAGGVAAATHKDDNTVATDGRAGVSTTSTTVAPTSTSVVDAGSSAATEPGSSGPVDPVPAGGDDNPTVDTGSGGGGQPTARIMPTPGTYRVTVTGTTSLNGQTQPVPPNGSYTITQLNDTDQDESGDFALRVRWAPGSASLLSLKLSAANKEFVPAEPVLYVPFPGETGTTWQWSMSSTDGKTSMRQTSRITGPDSVNVEGQDLAAFVVDTTITFSGDLTGTAHLISWVSPEHRLALKQHTVIDATFNLAFNLRSDTTSTLVSLTPG